AFQPQYSRQICRRASLNGVCEQQFLRNNRSQASSRAKRGICFSRVLAPWFLSAKKTSPRNLPLNRLQSTHFCFRLLATFRERAPSRRTPRSLGRKETKSRDHG